MKTLFRILIVLPILAGCDCAILPTQASQHQQIAAACEAAATAADAIASARIAGRLNKDQAEQALRMYKKTVPFCEPPVQALSASDFAVLLGVSQELTARAGGAK